MAKDPTILEAENHFEKALHHLGEMLRGIRTGRATSTLVDNIRVDYYGTPTPLNQLAAVTIPEARQIMIKPFDATILKEVGKAIMKSDLGVSPTDDGKVLRVNLPALSGEQRQKYANKVKELCEEARVAMRNSRREANKHADARLKKSEVTEDDHRKLHDDVQNLLKEWEKKVDEALDKKTKEVLE